MRAVVQRVSAASVQVDGRVVGELTLTDEQPQGLAVLVGVTHSDTPTEARALAEKIWRLRILDDTKSAADVDAPILVVSQFTLYADTGKGRRPSWNAAAPGPVAEPLVAQLVSELRACGATVTTGEFGAHMHVAMVNDGPVTIILDQ